MTGSELDPDAFNAFEAAGWERRAAGYDALFGQITPRFAERLLDAADVRRGARVLDVACGPGYVAAAAARRGASVVGVDVAETMLALARRAHPELELLAADAEDLPFADATFDAVVANFLLLHLGRPERAVTGFARVLRPGGRVALTVWDVPDRARFVGVWLDAVAAAGARPPEDIPAGPPFFRFSDEDEFARLLIGAGLERIVLQRLTSTLRVASADAFWDGFLGGTVRTSALVERQAPETRDAIRTAFDEIVREYAAGDGLELPVSVVLGSGARLA